ncbi:MAG TPA: hypothetical protein VLV32_00015 [Burkholderiales bacterium]|jgi:hypothetical protein|nr:hypothetical protein [Burkholderiales bacterium]
MKSMIRPFLFAAVILAAGFVSGCSGNPTVTSTPTPITGQPSKYQPLTDIPIPSESKLDTENSVILGDPQHWVGRAVLNVNLSMADASVFYQKQMPSFGWELVTVAQGKTTNMTFTRPDRVASMQIEPKTFGGSTVTILMSPRELKEVPNPAPQPEPAPQAK